MQDRIKSTQEKDQEWQRRGKKYKTKYFTALKDLFGETKNDKDCQIQSIKQSHSDNW